MYCKVFKYCLPTPCVGSLCSVPGTCQAHSGPVSDGGDQQPGVRLWPGSPRGVEGHGDVPHATLVGLNAWYPELDHGGVPRHPLHPPEPGDEVRSVGAATVQAGGVDSTQQAASPPELGEGPVLTGVASQSEAGVLHCQTWLVREINQSPLILLSLY